MRVGGSLCGPFPKGAQGWLPPQAGSQPPLGRQAQGTVWQLGKEERGMWGTVQWWGTKGGVGI